MGGNHGDSGYSASGEGDGIVMMVEDGKQKWYMLFLLNIFIFVFLKNEYALPEQYKSSWNGKGFTTVPTEST